MKFIYSDFSDASFNLASEEYLLKHFKEDIFFLYINTPSIICGKHQNTLAEINFEYTHQNKIKVFRRLSGGGTVYHDEGNINFCFITNEEKGNVVNFDKYLAYVVKYLSTKGIEATIDKRHALLIGDRKISGNASHVYKNRVMHHGTLLYDSELDVLNNCLKIDPTRYIDKAVKSVRSVVTNISDHLIEKGDVKEFSLDLFRWMANQFPQPEIYKMSDTDKQNINDLNRTKFTTWNWIYGYSPQYNLQKRVKLGLNCILSLEMSVTKGEISEMALTTENEEFKQFISKIEEQLKGRLHSQVAIEEILGGIAFPTWVDRKELNYLFF